ncbi:MAG: hypothetical protein HY905_17290 [Deltaproteobacteria bacterium]|nr:hypothetical protein [Deltaproteobacteria bacterium]
MDRNDRDLDAKNDGDAADGARPGPGDERPGDPRPPEDRGPDAPEPERADEPERSDGTEEDAGDAEGETEEDGDEDEAAEDADLPPPPDDGPLRVLPIRHLPLAEDGTEGARRASAEPYRGAAHPEPHGRVWHWVPLGALVALLATSLLSVAAGSLVPGAQESLNRLGESVAGIDGNAERMEVVEGLLSGPQGDALLQALLAMAAAFVLGLFLTGAVVSYYGRAGALEAGLAAATFVLLSLLFLGGGLPIMGLPGAALAFGFGWLGGRLGGWMRRRRDAKRRPMDLQ